MSRFESADVNSFDATSNDGLKKFKFDANFKYRIGFPYLKDTPDGKKLNIARVGYFPFNESLKKSFLVTTDAETNEKARKIMGDVKYRFVTPIIVYKTDSAGKLASPASYDIVPFVFSNDTLKSLQDINLEWNLAEADVYVRIKDGTKVDFQNLTFTVCKEALWSKGKNSADIMEKATAISENMYTAVAIDASPVQVAKWLGFNNDTTDNSDDNTGSSSTGASADVDTGVSDEDLDGWV